MARDAHPAAVIFAPRHFSGQSEAAEIFFGGAGGKVKQGGAVSWEGSHSSGHQSAPPGLRPMWVLTACPHLDWSL